MARQKLTRGEITLRQLYELSSTVYGTQVDDKEARANIDIVSGKITTRNNFRWDRKTKTWEETGRASKLTFIVITNPTSYKKSDNLRIHKYPVIFWFKDISMGLDSPFRWRTGSQFKPRFPLKSASKEQKKKLLENNIKNGIQMQFFFELEFVSRLWGALYGRCRANRPPTKTNPKKLLYLDKHAWFLTNKIVIPLFNSGKFQRRVARN